MSQDAIVIKLSDSALDELSRCTTKEDRGRCLLKFINPAIEQFNSWCEDNLGGPGAKFEVAFLRTFLYRAITGEVDGSGTIEDLPRVKLEGHPALN